MLTLAALGQQAGALHAYEQLRLRLDDQLGVLPGPELARAHLRVLRQQIPAAASGQSGPGDGPDTTDGPAGDGAPVPARWPGAVSGMVGGAPELAEPPQLAAEARGHGAGRRPLCPSTG